MLVKKITSGQRLDLHNVEEIGFLHVKGKAMVNEIINHKFDAIIVDEQDTLAEIRSREELFLYPIFSTLEAKHLKEVDGVFDPLTPLFSVGKVRTINHHFTRFKGLSLPDDPDQRALIKISRYLISRESSYSPLRNSHTDIAYSFNLLMELGSKGDNLSIIKMMDQFSGQNYFKKRVVDKINLCHKCDSAFLNFSECCTHCSSIDLSSEELVHHFRCAYVGPLSDFKKGDHLECPKCNHKLKHIGIDYDKPSEINTCNSCNYSSQETKMKAKCVSCGHDNTLESLRTYNICEYTPTDKAVMAANESHRDNKIKVEEYGFDPEGITAYPVFNILTNHERQKVDLYKNEIFLLNIVLKEKILRNLNQVHRHNLLSEIARITKPYLKERDLISLSPENVIECLMINYRASELKSLVEVIEYNLNKMVLDNKLAGGKSISMNFSRLTTS